MSSRLGLAALLLMLLAGGLFLLFRQFPGAAGSQGEQIRLVQGLLVLTLVGGSFLMGWNDSAGIAIKQALIWAGLLLVLLTVYAYRFEFITMGYRVAGVTLPTVPLPAPPSAETPTPDSTPPGTVYLSEVRGGHFMADAAVNGAHVRFLVDTGASFVALSAFDAQRLGFDLEELEFKVTVNTANGSTKVAPVTLDEVRIGAISRQNVPAFVSRDGELDNSLLGMTFLKSIGSFEMGDGVLILRD